MRGPSLADRRRALAAARMRRLRERNRDGSVSVRITAPAEFVAHLVETGFLNVLDQDEPTAIVAAIERFHSAAIADGVTP